MRRVSVGLVPCGVAAATSAAAPGRAGGYRPYATRVVHIVCTGLQDPHPAHRSEDACAGLGYEGLIAPLTFGSPNEGVGP